MKKDLTASVFERQNILNNPYALEQMKTHLHLDGTFFDGDIFFTKQQVMDLFEVADATIERYLSNYGDELKQSGYRILKSKSLREFKELSNGSLINEGTKTSVLGVFSFRSVLNLGMLLTDSEPARLLRSRILDIVLDVMSERAGGHTKLINQRDSNYLVAAFQEENYRKQFTNALDLYVDGNQWKYARFTNLIYQSIFRENATEYKKILNLAANDKIRETMYSEVLNLIASFESGNVHN
ncbi:hypothetical protein [Neisseria perflava]|uniref:hypothetical protein n=1 Tax=Neisseria perflava TaxID=33053 RepID=UPI00209D3F70|nr:hypothetical protein [Neisseria perflava]MCP1661034.1 hypothetical protein [Neisseria perflava]MCP1773036.1 hypothetical protein [Neisseria perflava]